MELCEAERQVFRRYFGELVTAIQSNVLTFTNKCLSSNLITSSTHDRISSAASSEEKATILLRAVQDCMKHQEECYGKFRQMLNELLIYKDLLKRMREMYQEIVKNMQSDKEKKTASGKSQACKQGGKDLMLVSKKAAKMPSSKEEDGQEVSRKVIKSFKQKLQQTLTDKFRVVASACREEELISSDDYNKILMSKKSVKRRVKSFIHIVSMLDGQKFSIFVEILKRLKSCKQLAQDMQEDIKRVSEYVVIHRESESRADIITSATQTSSESSVVHMKLDHTEETDRPISVSDVGDIVISGKAACLNSIHPAQLDPQIEREYNLRKEREQNEAQLEDLRQREEHFMEENKELQQTVKKLKADLHKAEDEKSLLIVKIEEMVNEIENLKFAKESLNNDFSRVEKEKYELRKNLESKINDLEIAKNKSEKQLMDLTCQVQDLQQDLATNQVKTKTLEDKLERTQSELNEALSRLCEEAKRASELQQALSRRYEEIKGTSKKHIIIITCMFICTCIIITCMFICIMVKLW